MDYKEICRKAIEKYGVMSQIGMMHEEMGELSAALEHYKRGRCQKEDVVTEIADIMIVAAQMALYFGYDEVNAEIDRKLERLEKSFSEERESEDERIRKALIEGFKHYDESYKWFGGIEVPDILAWLEKQKYEYEVFEPIENTLEYKAGFKAGIESEKQKEQKPPIAGNDFGWIDELKHDLEHPEELDQKVQEVLKKRQKPAESISRLTVQDKGFYKICPRCKERMVRDDSKVYTSMPPQYGYNCPKCGNTEFDTVMYDNPEMEEQKPIEYSKNDKDKSILTILVDALKGNAQLEWELKSAGVDVKRLVAYIEEQKEPTEELSTRLNGLMQEYVKSGKDEEEQEHRLKCYQLFWDALGDSEFFKQKEQKPAEYLDKDKVYAIMSKLHNLSFSRLIPINSDEFKKISEITSDVRSLLDYPIEQKHMEWSEEDEEHLDSIIESYKELLKVYSANNDVDYIPYYTPGVARTVLNDIKFLKSLRPHPKQEWSEEDEDYLMDVKAAVNDYYFDEGYAEELCTWLKSLRSRPNWKPSVEQMKALNKVANEGALLDLFNDLLNLL